MSQAGIVDIEGSHPQIPTSFVTNMGTAIPIGNVLEVLGTTVAAHSIPLETTGSGNTVTIVAQYASGAASSVATNAGFASFSSTQFTVDANGYVTLNGSSVAQTITGNTGGALSPVLGNWNIFGSSVAAGTTPVHTAGSGNTLTVDVQISQAIAATDATKIGLAAFNSTYFTVDANGFVSFNGGLFGETITGNTGGALSPTAGNWNILGTSTAAGTTPVQTAGAGSTLTIQVQKSQAIASTDATKVGLAAFNSTFFTVDANGFVSINGAAIAETITGNTGGALSPTAGNWNILGTSTAAGTTPVQTSGTGSTLTVQVQKAQAIAATDATKVGLANFNSADFSVDANGFVSAASTGYIRTITGTTGGAESPAAGGNFNLLGATALAGTTPVVVAGTANTETIKVQISQAIASTDATKVGLATFDSADFTVDANGFVSATGSGFIKTITGTSGGALSPTAGNITFLAATVAAGSTPAAFAGSVSTETLNLQFSQAIASTGATKVGLAAFNSAFFTVDANGFVSVNGAGLGETITGNTGGALSPSSGNWNILGTASTTTSGSGSTLTVALTGITQYNVQTGGATAATLNNVAPSATSGVPLISQGSASQPIFGTAVVAGGGTGATSFTAYAPVCGGTTTTGALQSASTGLSTSGFVLTSNGSSALPSFQAVGVPTFSINIQTFTGSGTYTPTSGMSYCIIECAGGGGGGGGSASATAGFFTSGAGGGAGGYSRKFASAATIGASQTVTIGAAGSAGASGNNAGGNGGDTSVGTICIGKGGLGGAGNPGTAAAIGGAGGATGTGDLTFQGQNGSSGNIVSGTVSDGILATGGNGFFGGGASTYVVIVTTAGHAAYNYGSGGGGGISYNATGATTGGAGSAGIVVITEYIT